MTDSNNIQIDTAAIEKEINQLSHDDLKAALLKVQVRQKKQQKKMQGSESQKKYQMTQRERIKALKAKAKELGLWDEINEEANRRAEAELAEETEVETEDVA